MLRDDPYISVPSYFRCPISLDVMKAPVSLCTGVTYDRPSIQRWLDGGNNTCPATMQVLHSKDLVPNHTLQRLIKLWLDDDKNNKNSATRLSHAPPSSKARVAETVHLLQTHIQRYTNASRSTYSLQLSVIEQCVTRLVAIAGEGDVNAVAVSTGGSRLLPLLVKAVDKLDRDQLCLLEKIVLLCNVLLKNYDDKDNNQGQAEDRKRVHSSVFGNSATWISTCLKQGRLELRIAIIHFLNLTSKNDINSCSSLLQANEDAYRDLLRSFSDISYDDTEALDAALSLLTRLASSKRNKLKMIRAGFVGTLGRKLSEGHEKLSSTTVVERVLKLLEMASRCEEGRDEICTNEPCVEALVKSLLKASTLATEHAVTVLWVVSCLYGDKRTAEVMLESNGMAKILVVLQSGCSQTVRGMCGDLLRALRCSACKGSSCVTWYYNSKTTHIMPF